MIIINAIGQQCPIPVVMTKKEIAKSGAGEYKVLVDNKTAFENIQKLAKNGGYDYKAVETEEGGYEVEITVSKVDNDACESQDCSCDDGIASCSTPCEANLVVSIGSSKMGEGNDELGKVLIKGFIFALSQLETLPKTILFYNSGAYLTCEGSESLEDLTKLSNEGVVIKTCGTCLDKYGLKDKLAVGEVTNMYDIVETLSKATNVIKP